MRWRFLDLANPDESAYQAETLDRIDHWSRSFEKKAPSLDALFSRKTEWDLPEWMGQTLQAIHEDIMWEFGPAIRGKGHRLVITPESQQQLRPLVATLLGRAPHLPGWEFYGYRVPEGAEGAGAMVEARTGGSLDGVVVQVTGGRFGRFDLRFLGPETSGSEDEQATDDAFVATETLLGEELLDKHVGAIEVERLPAPDGPRPIPLDRLLDTVRSAVAGRRDQLPDRPCHEWALSNGTPWSCLELQPEDAEEYAGLDDLFVAVSSQPELFQAALADRLFYSERFSRFGETFCYLKVDGINGLVGSAFGDRGDIENSINAALSPEKLGCTIGGGTGRRYSYVELALTDLDRGIERIRECLVTGRIPRRSWIQFHDAHLCAEWVGIYRETPAPPGFEEPGQ